MNLAQFIFNVMASVYFTVGSRLEERKLLVYYGERYRSYMQRVPGLFPLPWKFISAAEARRICGE
jgi:protein-S-isoprenylcysteine O-methyltransferase Ste14